MSEMKVRICREEEEEGREGVGSEGGGRGVCDCGCEGVAAPFTSASTLW